MFDKTAEYYDVLYEKGLGKDYAAESERVADLVPGATTLLDVACGTGLHLQHLRTRFDCNGIDLDEGMVAIARERCPGVPIHVGDMVDFDLGRTFDAIICLFSSIGYVATETRLHEAATTFARHLAPGGTIVVEPWFQPTDWTVGYSNLLVVNEPDLKIARMSMSGRVNDVSSVEFHYLVATSEGITHEVERHELGLFTWDQYRNAFEAAGLNVEVQTEGGPMGRGLITARS
jgi:SAM-dependent methyltransferase